MTSFIYTDWEQNTMVHGYKSIYVSRICNATVAHLPIHIVHIFLEKKGKSFLAFETALGDVFTSLLFGELFLEEVLAWELSADKREMITQIWKNQKHSLLLLTSIVVKNIQSDDFQYKLKYPYIIAQIQVQKKFNLLLE